MQMAIKNEEQAQQKRHALPAPIVESLISLGLRTEQGGALIAGYRLGHPDFAPEKGSIQLVSAHAEVMLVPPSPDQ